MRFSVYTLVAAAVAVNAQTATLTSTVVAAPTVSSNPKGASYTAKLPEKGTVRGSIIGTSGNDGVGVQFSISVSGLPSEGGPFMYHIHEKPVPSDGNCTGAGAHLDPYKRGEVPPCDSSKKETCQTGDLSGKYRNLTGPADSDSYIDLYTSTNPSDPSFFGDKSIVVHFSNKTRISCANFTLDTTGSPVSSGYALPSGSGFPNGTHSAHQPSGTGDSNGPSHGPTFTSASPTQPAPTGNGGHKLMVAGAGVVAGVVAIIL